MNEPAQRWVSILETGDYSQTKYHLRTDKGYCCLGVACDLFIQEHPEDYAWVKLLPHDKHFTFCHIVLEDGVPVPRGLAESELPQVVQDWLGMRTDNGWYMFIEEEEDDNDGPCETQLTELNDDVNYNFSEIAAVIKSEPEGLFKSA